MLIIDIGSGDGASFAIPQAQELSNWIYAIEPCPDLADKLRAANLPNLEVVPVAMGATDGQATLYSASDGSASLVAAGEAQPVGYAGAEYPVAVLRLDSFIRDRQIVDIDFLKIDVPEQALAILAGAGAALGLVQRLLVVVGAAGGDRNAVVDVLTNRGFRLAIDHLPPGGTQESLEFVRVNRFNRYDGQATQFQVEVPHLGSISTPLGDDVGQYLEQGVFEGPEQAFTWLYLRPGDTFLDCGAHVGLFSCIAALRLHNQGSIYGFDPNPDCIDLYRQNLERLGCRCFETRTIGLSDVKEPARFLIPEPGKAAFGRVVNGVDAAIEPAATTTEIELDTLDHLLQDFGIEQVALAKLDVEGWEAFVLRGAAQSIRAQTFAVWMIEFTEDNALATGSSTLALRDLIEELGYTLCRFDATHFRLVPEPPRLQYSYQNLFAVLDLDAVNGRLATAGDEATQIARDMVARWDTAVIATMGLTLIGRNHSQLLKLQKMQHQKARLTDLPESSLRIQKKLQQQLQEANLELHSEQQAQKKLQKQLQEANLELRSEQQAQKKLQKQLQEAGLELHSEQQAQKKLQQQLQDTDLELRQIQQRLRKTEQRLHYTEQLVRQSQRAIAESPISIFDRIYAKLTRPRSLRFGELVKQYAPSSLLQFLREAKDRSNKLALEQGTRPEPLRLPRHYYGAPPALTAYPPVSIVTPSYNQADYIGRTVESVLAQNYPNLEYIIEDGASTDDTLRVLEQYRNQVPHIYSQPDTGQASAINRGFAKASGDILAWINSDDLLLPGALPYVVNYFNNHPEVDVVYGHRVIINKFDQITGRWILPPHSDAMVTWADYIPQETMFWRRHIWEKVGAQVDESFQFALDWDLILRFREQGAVFARLPRFLGAFRVYADQKTSAWTEVGEQEMARLRQRCHGRPVSHEEINRCIRPYQNQAWRCYWLHRLGLLRH